MTVFRTHPGAITICPLDNEMKERKSLLCNQVTHRDVVDLHPSFEKLKSDELDFKEPKKRPSHIVLAGTTYKPVKK